jgi:hypothetical protein
MILSLGSNLKTEDANIDISRHYSSTGTSFRQKTSRSAFWQSVGHTARNSAFCQRRNPESLPDIPHHQHQPVITRPPPNSPHCLLRYVPVDDKRRIVKRTSVRSAAGRVFCHLYLVVVDSWTRKEDSSTCREHVVIFLDFYMTL